MLYVPKTDWKYNDVLSENDMNRIEGGIAEGKQFIEAHATDMNNPHGVTAAQIGAETPSEAQAKVDTHVNTSAGAHKASAIAVDNTGGHFTATNVEGALAEVAAQQAQLFTSGDNGKAQVAAAVIAKGGTVAGTAPHSFQELADGVTSIKVGDYSIGNYIDYKKLGLGRSATPPVLPYYPGGAASGIGISSSGFVYITLRSYSNVRKHDDSGVQKASFAAAHGAYNIYSMVVAGDKIITFYRGGTTNTDPFYVRMIDESGVQQWLTNVGSGTNASSSGKLLARGDHVYHFHGTMVRKINATTGSIVWQWNCNNDIYHLAVDAGETVVYGSYYSTAGGGTKMFKLRGDGTLVTMDALPSITMFNRPISIETEGKLFYDYKCFNVKDDGTFTYVFNVTSPDTTNFTLALSNGDALFGSGSDCTFTKYNSTGQAIYSITKPMADTGDGGMSISAAHWDSMTQTLYFGANYAVKILPEKIKVKS